MVIDSMNRKKGLAGQAHMNKVRARLNHAVALGLAATESRPRERPLCTFLRLAYLVMEIERAKAA